MPKPTPEAVVSASGFGCGVYQHTPISRDGTTHSATYVVWYGSRKFTARVSRVLLPAAKGKKRRTDSEVQFYCRSSKWSDAAMDYARLSSWPPAVEQAARAAFAEGLEALRPSPNAKRVTMRQVGGDDGYCWAVMVDGVPKWEGMQRGEAGSRRTAEIKRLDDGQRGPADVDSREQAARLDRNLYLSRLDVAASEATITAARKRAAAALQQSA